MYYYWIDTTTSKKFTMNDIWIKCSLKRSRILWFSLCLIIVIVIPLTITNLYNLYQVFEQAMYRRLIMYQFRLNNLDENVWLWRKFYFVHATHVYVINFKTNFPHYFFHIAFSIGANHFSILYYWHKQFRKKLACS